MKIVLITNVYPTPVEPTKGLFNHYLARALAAEHEVSVVAPVSWLDELRGMRRHGSAMPRARAELKDGIPVAYPRYFYPPRALRSTYGWFYWQSIRRIARRMMGANPPDVVLSFWAHPDGAAAARAARERGIPSVVLVGGSDVLLLAKNESRRQRVADVLRSSDSVIAVSNDLANKIRTMGVSADKVHVWTRGVDFSTFHPGDRAGARQRLGLPTSVSSLVWVGRMVPVKGLDILLDACSLLRQRTVPFHLYLVGDGPSRKVLEGQARSLGVSDKVTFCGPRLHNELPDWYRAADLTVLPSRSEGIPNVLRESLACGTPFVASRVGGIPEIATESCLRLVPPGDPVALADAIAESLAARDAVAPTTCSTSWAESADALIRILEPLVSRSTRRIPSARESHAVLH